MVKTLFFLLWHELYTKISMAFRVSRKIKTGALRRTDENSFFSTMVVCFLQLVCTLLLLPTGSNQELRLRGLVDDDSGFVSFHF